MIHPLPDHLHHLPVSSEAQKSGSISAAGFEYLLRHWPCPLLSTSAPQKPLHIPANFLFSSLITPLVRDLSPGMAWHSVCLSLACPRAA